MLLQQRLDAAFRRIVQLLKQRTGDLINLETADKTNLVAALNELKNDIDTTSSINDAAVSTTTGYSSSKTEELLDEKVNVTDTINANLLTGTINSDRLPVINYFKSLVTTASSIAALTLTDQASISDTGKNGTFNTVTLADGSTYVYNGTGSKTLLSSYTLLSDTTPDFSAVINKPTTLAGYGITDSISISSNYSNPSWITTLAWSKLTGTPTTLLGYGITDAQPFINPTTTSQYFRGDKTFQPLTKAVVGLSNVVDSLQVINTGGGVSIGSGAFNTRPIVGTAGRFFYTTDTGVFYFDNGTTWNSVIESQIGNPDTNFVTIIDNEYNL